jgi:hypothetical protein
MVIVSLLEISILMMANSEGVVGMAVGLVRWSCQLPKPSLGLLLHNAGEVSKFTERVSIRVILHLPSYSGLRAHPITLQHHHAQESSSYYGRQNATYEAGDFYTRTVRHLSNQV